MAENLNAMAVTGLYVKLTRLINEFEIAIKKQSSLIKQEVMNLPENMRLHQFFVNYDQTDFKTGYKQTTSKGIYSPEYLPDILLFEKPGMQLEHRLSVTKIKEKEVPVFKETLILLNDFPLETRFHISDCIYYVKDEIWLNKAGASITYQEPMSQEFFDLFKEYVSKEKYNVISRPGRFVVTPDCKLDVNKKNFYDTTNEMMGIINTMLAAVDKEYCVDSTKFEVKRPELFT